ncbi:MAG: SDR family NAD(P)-dependent oxidoreductase [Beijerinckiaceae bacterium]
MANRIDLDGKTAIITGGAQGIGYAIAARLADSGAKLILWDRDASVLEEARRTLGRSGGAVEIVSCDVSDWASVETAAKQSWQAFGRIDILVNNAGISGPNATVAEYPVDEWRRVIDIDLNGVFYSCKAVVPAMVAQNYGRIVNVASIAGKEGNPNAGAYSAAKAGVIALTKSLGKELAGHDIGVNCITPAAARTRIFDQMTQTHIDYMLAKIPRARFVLVEEIAAMVAFLVSAENSFTTGAVFDLSGGRATY